MGTMNDTFPSEVGDHTVRTAQIRVRRPQVNIVVASPANETVFQGYHKAWFPYVAHLGTVRNANDAPALRNRERGTVGLSHQLGKLRR